MNYIENSFKGVMCQNNYCATRFQRSKGLDTSEVPAGWNPCDFDKQFSPFPYLTMALALNI